VERQCPLGGAAAAGKETGSATPEAAKDTERGEYYRDLALTETLVHTAHSIGCFARHIEPRQ
jgi:hypothetical protein